MKIGFSTNAYSKKSLEYAINSIADIGYEGVELVLDAPHAFLPITKEKKDSIKNCIKKCDVELTNLNANTVEGWYSDTVIEKFEPSLSNKNEKLRQWRIDYTKNAIKLAEELGAPSISITSGISNGLNNEYAMENYVKSLKEVTEYAEIKNIFVGIEYEPGLLIANSNDVYSLMKSSFKNLGLNLDVCHAAVNGECIPLLVEKFGKKILHTHISDCKNQKHFHLIPGLGDINFLEMYNALKKIGYDKYLTVELYPYSDYPKQAAKAGFILLNGLIN